ncbi:cupin domain-containing protein [Sphingobacterium lactis]|uniref:cupin domain-containing protein n=1 Tax=Sphingobacterium lactis TaxID=797291 RepID=UPI003DA25AB9
MIANNTKENMGVQILQSAAMGGDSILEFVIKPGEKTPKHYHRLFTESFEILAGSLSIGLGNAVRTFHIGEKLDIAAHCVHYFHNVSEEDCLVRVTVQPGNLNFERALNLSKRLAAAGLASPAGTPKRFKDLALFVFLNDSHSVGLLGMVQPVLTFVAKWQVKNGYLKSLLNTYKIT